MTLEDDVQEALFLGDAEPGYVVSETDDGIEVEYPDDQEVAAMAGIIGQPSTWRLAPGSRICTCDDILQLAGYETELVPGYQRHRLIVRQRG